MVNIEKIRKHHFPEKYQDFFNYYRSRIQLKFTQFIESQRKIEEFSHKSLGDYLIAKKNFKFSQEKDYHSFNFLLWEGIEVYLYTLKS